MRTPIQEEMKKRRLIWSLVIVIAVLTTGVVLFPLYAVNPWSARQAAVRSLENELSRGYSNAHPEVLRVIWMSAGDPRRMEEVSVEPDRSVWVKRRIWNYAIQGGGRPPADGVTMDAIHFLSKKLPPSTIDATEGWQPDEVWVALADDHGWDVHRYTQSTLPTQVRNLTNKLASVTITTTR